MTLPAAASAKQQTYGLAITQYNSTMKVGDEISTVVNVVNNFTRKKNFTICSYIYSGNNPVSLGFSDEKKKWQATYSANEQIVEVDGLSNKTISLVNRIEDGTEPGDYNLRARIKYGNETRDVTLPVVIGERPAAVKPSVSETEHNTTDAEPAPLPKQSQVTAMAVSSPKKFDMNVQRMFSPVWLIMQFIEKLIRR
jgi:hypothetical protein